MLYFLAVRVRQKFLKVARLLLSATNLRRSGRQAYPGKAQEWNECKQLTILLH